MLLNRAKIITSILILLCCSIDFAFSQITANGYTLVGPVTPSKGVAENYSISVSSGTTGIAQVTWSVEQVPYTIVSGQNTANASIIFEGAGTAIIRATVINQSFNSTPLSNLISVVNVDVGPVSFTAGTNLRCKGGGTTNYDASAGNADSYTWSLSSLTGGNPGSINSSTGVVSWISSYSGTVQVTVIANGANGTTSDPASRNVTVSAPPLVYTLQGGGEICPGNLGGVALPSTQSGVNYQLRKGGSNIGPVRSGGSTIAWNDLNVGTYEVVASYSNGLCGSVPMSNSVTIGTATPGNIIISTNISPNNICPGSSVTLTATGSTGGYTWSTGQTTPSITVSPTTNTIYTVTGPVQCDSTFDSSVEVTVGPVTSTPNVTSTPACDNGPVSMTASGVSGATYRWYDASGAYITSVNPFVPNLSQTTNYKVSATVNGCESPLINVQAIVNTSQMWYADNDGDGFRDPDSTGVPDCDERGTGWTNDPTVDICPYQPSITNQGCDPDCGNGVLVIDGPYGETGPPAPPTGIIVFAMPQAGGVTKAKINFPNDSCAPDYSISIVGTVPSGFTIPTPAPNTNIINIDATALNTAGASRSANLTIKLNPGNHSIGTLTISQSGPPLPCLVDGFSNRSYGGTMQEDDFPITFQNCSAFAYTFKYYEINNGNTIEVTPAWISAAQQPSNSTIRINLQPNDTENERSIVVEGTATGKPTISAIITQACNPKTWYVDSDNDGFRDPDSTGIPDCANRGAGWTQNGGTPDVCPNLPNNDPTSNGCPPPCTFELSSTDFVNQSPQVMAFDNNGGEQNVTVGNYLNCTNPKTITISYRLQDGTLTPSLNWLQVTPNLNNLKVDCESTTEARSVYVIVTVNDSEQTKEFYVTQSGQPVPDPACEITAINDVIIDPDGDTKNITVSFENIAYCPSSSSFELEIVQITGLTDWLTLTTVDNNTYTLSALANPESITQQLEVVVYVNDSSGNRTDIGTSFMVTQATCTTLWYPDTDGDMLGDVFGECYIGCVAPDNGDGIVWVQNNDDLCPLEMGTLENQGCPPGKIPEQWNTVTSKGYDINGTLKVAGKTYFDALGKLQQSQSLDIETGRIWASETMYDSQGRPALQTLSAPTDRDSFAYKPGFTLNSSGIAFSPTDFETGNLETPSTVSPMENTLGWYYSENNTDDFHPGNSYQDITDRPYSRTIYSTLMPDVPLKTVGGNKPDTDGDGNVTNDPDDIWPRAYTFSMRASQELSQTVSFGETKYNSYKIIKTVSRDVHRVENVIFTDTDGKTLAAARSGGTAPRTMQITVPEQGYVDIHVPAGDNMGFTVATGGNAITTYDLITETTVSPSTSLPNGFYRVSVNDPDTYSGGVTVSYKENYYDYSLNEYDLTGRLTDSYQPLDKLHTEYQYDTEGQLIHTKSPDEGEAWFKYREDGQIRFSQNSKQKDPNEDDDFSDAEFSYTNYDTYGRPVESGVYKEGNGVTFANADNLLENVVDDITVDNDGLPDANCSERTFTLYDVTDTAGLHTALTASGIPTGPYTVQKFTSGNVSKTYSTEPGNNTATWYSYDIYGRVEWLLQDIEGIGAKTIDYAYDPITGQVLRVDYQKDNPSERFVHKYEYNTIDQLVKVTTSTDGVNFNETEPHATYEYYETGSMKRTELAGGVQGIDYVYNLAGQLKSLNHPSLQGTNDPNGDTNDLFGMQLDYHSNDYQRPLVNITSPTYGQDQLNGNIKGIRWKNDAVPGATSELMYSYQYDRNNWLTGADFGGDGTIASNIDVNGSSTDVIVDGETRILEATNSIDLLPGFTAETGSTVTVQIVSDTGGVVLADGDYDVSNITYDANGNILTLKRNKNTPPSGEPEGAAMDDLTYTYKNGTNQLLQVEDGIQDPVIGTDIGNQPDFENYKYNKIGQLIENKAEQIAYIYNTAGLVTEVKKDNKTVVKFYYNDRNHRVRKERYDSTGGSVNLTTHYVRDVAGQVMGIYINDLLMEQPIYGGSRLGVYYPQDDISVYELTDHLGNVRAAFAKTANNGTDLHTGSDYYPFGMPMPGRNIVGDYRYAFQGQEKDPETGKEAFELRLWDSRIGRWLTTDPAGQYSSPYLGMGNNPMNGTDPDGAFWQELGNWLAGKGWASNEALNFLNDNGITEYESHFSSNALDGTKRHSISYIDSDGNATIHAFKNVDDYRTDSGSGAGFRVTAGFQAGFDISKTLGIDINLYSTTLLEQNFLTGERYNTFTSNETRTDFLTFEIAAGVNGGFGFSHTGTKNQGLFYKGSNFSGDVHAGVTSLFQLGYKFDDDDPRNAGFYTQHGYGIGGAALIRVEVYNTLKVYHGQY